MSQKKIKKATKLTVCCLSCGTDTDSPTGYCGRCFHYNSLKSHCISGNTPHEMADRKISPYSLLGKYNSNDYKDLEDV